MPWVTWQIKKPATIARIGLERLRKRIPVVGRLRLYKAAIEVRRRMKKEGKPVTYPINWDSERQRKAFFATDGFGHGIPYKRTGEYQRNWKVVRTDVGYDIGNPLSHARYVGGTASRYGESEMVSRGQHGEPAWGTQSNIHRGRWPEFRRQINIVTKKLPLTVRRVLKVIARQAGFKPKGNMF